ncbi:replication terminator protein [Caldibacillus thermoamylovorans]|uniref:replication terminator protein n=1 Tax=Caldibacillus thermoamylovorans TaxID=35841 RepID=UPI001D08106F|nr:replication terminator protein [Caldibacillus thermoamylovorans]MCB5934465.1 replication terminator protein [Bacillus sp. DFI.2.34]MCB7076440.1 replication terminator protein [Caldibacillus thermoamylovorans]
MSNKAIDLQLSQLANGAIQEKLDYQLEKVFENIHDPNTKAEAKRTITIKLEFVPDENRQTIKVNCDMSHNLANVKGVSMTVLTGKDLSNGKIEAKELKSNIPGQTYFDDEGIKSDVGVPIDVIEREQNRKIINLQENKENRG